MELTLVDVFGSAPLRGNPLAVVTGGEGFDAARMLALTQWLGLLRNNLPARARASRGRSTRCRSSIRAASLPFAGHLTLGTCHAWLAAGGKPKRDG